MILDFTFERDEYIVAWRDFLLMKRTVTGLQLVATVICFPSLPGLLTKKG